PRMERGVREQLARRAGHSAPRAETFSSLLLTVPEILGHDGRMLIRGRRHLFLREHVRAGLMPAVGKADLQPATDQPLAHVAASAAARPDADEIDGSMTDVVIAVAAEVLGRELPVTGDQPLLDSAEHFRSAFAPVPRIQPEVEIAP